MSDDCRTGTARVLLVVVTALLTAIGLAGPASAGGGTTYVRPGQSIQTAIDGAHQGDRIVVRGGTYAEQLTVDTNGIELIGQGAVLVPPSTPVGNTCSGLAGDGTQAGVCVTGHDVRLDAFVVEHRRFLSVGTPVERVSITGFQVRGFSGADIAVVGARNTLVTGNGLADGGQYGFLTVGSEGTRITANTVTSATSLRFIGICMDDGSPAAASSNRVSGYVIALCVQTAGSQVRDNVVTASCVGAYVDPGVAGAAIYDNRIGATNPGCGDGAGIVLDGAVGTTVRGNHIEGQTVPGGTAAGVAVVDAGAAGPLASGNRVINNVLRRNDLDLYLASAGSGNVMARNQCSTSIPDGLCGRP